ncbi:alkaline phosphatase family protein [Streptomyces sp. CG1]|uniref:alkaline phosphatase family protein n=1 Tax=Streptomyces sp. CG1 TaxID=1287523 RepID=UPI0034E22975
MHPHRLARRLLTLVATLLLTLAPAISGGSASAQTAGAVPAFDHVFTILMENHSYNEIVGNSQAPYINSLVSKYGIASNYFAVGHPSLPNYLELTGGSNFGIATDCNPSQCTVNQPNIAADRITPAGKTWKAYEESMPAPCTLSDSGEYAVRHNPFVYYTDLQTTAQCNNDVPYTQLATDLGSTTTTPNYAFITPNLIDDMHDGTIAQGDTWLSQNVPNILNSPPSPARTRFSTSCGTRTTAPRTIRWRRSSSASRPRPATTRPTRTTTSPGWPRSSPHGALLR